jgi:hypothetical protein
MAYIRTMTEVCENEYNKLIELEKSDKKAFHEMIEEIAYRSPFKPNAYDCTIPMEAFELSGKYYASWNRWDSCD